MIPKTLFILFASTVTIYSQSRVDSYLHPKVFQTYLQTPVLLPASSIENFTNSGLSFQTEKGDLHLGQQPSAVTTISLNTNGYYKAKKTAFFGDVTIKREYQADKKWNLSYVEVAPDGLMPDPHYYAVSKASNWNAQQYQVFGGLITPLITSHLNGMIAARYHLGEKYRTSFDPRPKIITNELAFTAQLALNLTSQQQIAIGTTYGLAQVDNSISFSDSDSHIPMNYPKYLRWQLGYGTFELPTDVSTKRERPFNELTLHYHYTTPTTQWIAGVHCQWQKANTYQSNTEYEADERLMATLNTTNYKVYIQRLKKLSEAQLRYYAQYTETSRKNFLNLQQGKNYEAQLRDVQFSVHYYSEKYTQLCETAVMLGYHQAYQTDVLAQTLTDRHFLTAQALHSRSYQLSGVEIAPFVAFQCQLPTYSKLENQNIEYYKTLTNNDYAAKTIRLFYDEVVYPDNTLLCKTQYHFSFGTDFKQQLRNHLFAVLGVKTTYSTTFKSDDRYHLSLHLQLNY